MAEIPVPPNITMKKPKKQPIKRRRAHRRPKGLSKNPAHGLPGLDKLLADNVGTLYVTCALHGATFDEKMLIAALIPSALAIIRGIPKATLGELIDKLDMEPGTANANPSEDAPPAGGKE